MPSFVEDEQIGYLIMTIVFTRAFQHLHKRQDGTRAMETPICVPILDDDGAQDVTHGDVRHAWYGDSFLAVAKEIAQKVVPTLPDGRHVA